MDDVNPDYVAAMFGFGAKTEAHDVTPGSGPILTPEEFRIRVIALFDALIHSLDWGPGFLDAEEVESEVIAQWKAQAEARNRALEEEREEGEQALHG